MTKEQKEIIEALEKLVLEYVRKASDLDHRLRQIKLVCNGRNDETIEKFTIIGAAIKRNDFRRMYDYDNLDEREAELWEKLKATCKIES